MLKDGTAPVEIRVVEAGDDAPPALPTTPALASRPATPPAPTAPQRQQPQNLAGTSPIGVSSRYLQTGSFSQRVNAAAMVTRLAAAGIRNAQIREAMIGDRQVFRVQVGPIDDALEADDMIERLRLAGIPDARPAHE